MKTTVGMPGVVTHDTGYLAASLTSGFMNVLGGDQYLPGYFHALLI